MPEQLENRMVVDSEWEPHNGICKECERCESKVYSSDYIYELDGESLCEDCYDRKAEEIKMRSRRRVD